MTQPIPTPSKLRKTFELSKPICDYLHGYALIAVIVIVNILTLNLKLKPDEATNSTLLIGPSGHGRTTLIHHILRRSNQQFFPKLPDKLFESEIMKMPHENFNNKVWVQDDLITTFRGTSTKQREQLMGFFNAFLTKGEYGRRDNTVQGRIVCVFGIASEVQKKYAKQMFLATFTDRFIPVEYDFDERLEREILQAKRINRGSQPPRVILPLKPNSVDPVIPSAFYSEIDELALELNRKGKMSSIRAQTYIENFLKSNAALNDRISVCEDDMMLLRLVWPLHFGANLGSVDMRIRMLILEKSINGEAITGQEIKKEIMSKLGCSGSAVKKSLSELRNKNVVHFKKIPLKRGYDYCYWL